MRRAPLLALLVVVLLPAAAQAAPYLPERGRTWHGVTAGLTVTDFKGRVGKRPAVWQFFIRWDGKFEIALQRAARARTRVMLHISTAEGQNSPERITPGAIAAGRGDRWLVRLGRGLRGVGAPAYVRLFGEMNNCNNAYAPYSCFGGRRDAAHSPDAIKRAWRRVHIILRGGSRSAVNATLARWRLPGLRAPNARALARPQVAFVWAPMTGGSPEIPALRPEVFWPGGRFVDWVGTSFYSRFPTFNRLSPYYQEFAVRRNKPFALAEWAIWGSDAPGFVASLFSWIRQRPAVRMVSYNQGARPDSIFRLSRYPASTRVLRRALASPRFQAFAPENRR